MNLLSYLSFLSFFIDLVLVVAALWLDRRSALNRWCACIAFLFAIWAFGEVFFFVADDPESLRFFYRLSAIGWSFVPPVFLSFAFEFTGRPARFKLLIALPVYALSAGLLGHILTANDFLAEVYRSPLGNVGILASDTVWFWFNVALSNGSFLIVAALLVYSHLRARSKRYRRQSRVLMAVLSSTVAANVFIDIFLPPVWRFTAILWVIPIGAILFLIVRYRFMRLDYPLVEQEILGTMDEGIVLVDAGFTAIKANPAALRMFGNTEGTGFLGRRLEELFDRPGALLERWKDAVGAQRRRAVEDCVLGGNSVVVFVSPSFDTFGDLIGGIVLVRMRNLLDNAALEFGITAQEKRIALMLMEGSSNREIADALYISTGTVKTHVHNLYQKTNVANRVGLVRVFIDGASVPALSKTDSSGTDPEESLERDRFSS